MLAEIIIAVILLIVLITIIFRVSEIPWVKTRLDNIDFWDKLIAVGIITTVIGMVLNLANTIAIARQEGIMKKLSAMIPIVEVPGSDGTS